MDCITWACVFPDIVGYGCYGLLCRSDKVLFAALQSLKAQVSRVEPLQRVALRELCAQYYLMLAGYLFWIHWNRTGPNRRHTLKHVRPKTDITMHPLPFTLLSLLPPPPSPLPINSPTMCSFK